MSQQFVSLLLPNIAIVWVIIHCRRGHIVTYKRQRGPV